MSKRKLVAFLSSCLIFAVPSSIDASRISSESTEKSISSKTNAKFKKFLMFSPLLLLPLASTVCTPCKKKNESKEKKSACNVNTRPADDNKNHNDKIKNVERFAVASDYNQEIKSDTITFLDCYNALQLVRPTINTKFQKTLEMFFCPKSLKLSTDELSKISSALGFLLGQLGIKNKHFCVAGTKQGLPITFFAKMQNKNDLDSGARERLLLLKDNEFLFRVEISTSVSGCAKIQFFVPVEKELVVCWTTSLFVNNNDSKELQESIKEFECACRHTCNHTGNNIFLAYGIPYDEYLISAKELNYL